MHAALCHIRMQAATSVSLRRWTSLSRRSTCWTLRRRTSLALATSTFHSWSCNISRSACSSARSQNDILSDASRYSVFSIQRQFWCLMFVFVHGLRCCCHDCCRCFPAAHRAVNFFQMGLQDFTPEPLRCETFVTPCIKSADCLVGACCACHNTCTPARQPDLDLDA